ncbi:hypothetical protein JQ032_04195 [Clostridium botulinum]|nr:hypothetical protein [Clostridium botulinum]
MPLAFNISTLVSAVSVAISVAVSPAILLISSLTSLISLTGIPSNL